MTVTAIFKCNDVSTPTHNRLSTCETQKQKCDLHLFNTHPCVDPMRIKGIACISWTLCPLLFHLRRQSPLPQTCRHSIGRHPSALGFSATARSWCSKRICHQNLLGHTWYSHDRHRPLRTVTRSIYSCIHCQEPSHRCCFPCRKPSPCHSMFAWTTPRRSNRMVPLFVIGPKEI